MQYWRGSSLKWPDTNCGSNQGSSLCKKLDILEWPPSWFQHSGAYFSGAVGRSEGKKTYKQAASEGGCSEGLRKETQQLFLNSHELTSSLGEKWLHESLGWNVEMVLIFTQKTELCLSVELLYQIPIKCPSVRQSCNAVTLQRRINSMMFINARGKFTNILDILTSQGKTARDKHDEFTADPSGNISPFIETDRGQIFIWRL